MEEIAALYNEQGEIIGSAPRSRVRAENLRHGATGIVVFNPQGQIYVHQRTWIKDVYPGLFDFSAGGVIQAGEDPLVSAQREAEEELGVHGELVSLGEANYQDESTQYHAFCFWVIATEPLQLQPEEVIDGRWVEVSDLILDIEARPQRYMPDAVQLFLPWLETLGTLPPSNDQ